MRKQEEEKKKQGLQEEPLVEWNFCQKLRINQNSTKANLKRSVQEFPLNVMQIDQPDSIVE